MINMMFHRADHDEQDYLLGTGSEEAPAIVSDLRRLARIQRRGRLQAARRHHERRAALQSWQRWAERHRSILDHPYFCYVILSHHPFCVGWLHACWH